MTQTLIYIREKDPSRRFYPQK